MKSPIDPLITKCSYCKHIYLCCDLLDKPVCFEEEYGYPFFRVDYELHNLIDYVKWRIKRIINRF